MSPPRESKPVISAATSDVRAQARVRQLGRCVLEAMIEGALECFTKPPAAWGCPSVCPGDRLPGAVGVLDVAGIPVPSRLS